MFFLAFFFYILYHKAMNCNFKCVCTHILFLFFLVCFPLQAKAQEENTAVPHDSAWYPKGSPQGTKGDLWEKGTSASTLTEKLDPQVVFEQKLEGTDQNIRRVLQSKLEAIEKEEQKSGLSSIPIESAEEGAEWHSPSSKPVVIDEEILVEKRDVVGAYAPIVDDDDFRISVGPELHIPQDNDSPLQGKSGVEQSEIGMGMRLMWDF